MKGLDRGGSLIVDNMHGLVVECIRGNKFPKLTKIPLLKLCQVGKSDGGEGIWCWKCLTKIWMS